MKKYISLILTFFLLIVSAYADSFEFYDLTDDYSWAADDISYLTDNGIINGFPDGSFKPNENITNAQAAKIITLMFGNSENTKSYSDVDKDSWYYEYAENSGDYFIRDDKFLPNENSKRQEIVYAIYKAAKLSKAENMTEFNEVIDEEYYEALVSAYETGIIKGYPDGSVRPQEPVTRAEFAVMVMRAKRLVSEETTEPEVPQEPILPDEPQEPTEPEKPEKVIKSNNYFFVVTEVSKVSENGAVLTKVKGMNDGIDDEFVVDEEDISITDATGGGTTLRAETVLFVFMDYFGNVKRINIACDFNISPIDENGKGKDIKISAKQKYLDGIPTYANNDSNTIDMQTDGRIKVAEDARAYLYDDNVLNTKGSLARIKTDKDRVFAYVKDDIIQEYIIIRQKN